MRVARVKASRWIPVALMGIALSVGCSGEENPAAILGKVTKSNPSSDTSAQGGVQPASTTATPAPTPSPTPSATPSPSPTPTTAPVSSGIDTSGTPAPLATIAPIFQPTPAPTPVGTLNAQPFIIPGSPKALAFQANTTYPWLVRSTGLAQIDTNGTILATYAGELSQPSLLQADGLYRLWVASPGANRVDAIDVLAQDGFALAASYSIPANANGLAVDATEVWLTHSDGQLTRITKASGAVQSFAIANPTAIALDGTSAWVVGAPSALYKVNRATGAVTSTYTVGTGPIAVGVDSAGTVWTANSTGQSLSRLASGAGAPTTTPLGAPPSALALDTNRLWVGMSSPRAIAWFGLDGTLQGSKALSQTPSALALDAMGRVWILDSTLGQVLYAWGR